MKDSTPRPHTVLHLMDESESHFNENLSGDLKQWWTSTEWPEIGLGGGFKGFTDFVGNVCAAYRSEIVRKEVSRLREEELLDEGFNPAERSLSGKFDADMSLIYGDDPEDVEGISSLLGDGTYSAKISKATKSGPTAESIDGHRLLGSSPHDAAQGTIAADIELKNLEPGSALFFRHSDLLHSNRAEVEKELQDRFHGGDRLHNISADDYFKEIQRRRKVLEKQHHAMQRVQVERTIGGFEEELVLAKSKANVTKTTVKSSTSKEEETSAPQQSTSTTPTPVFAPEIHDPIIFDDWSRPVYFMENTDLDEFTMAHEKLHPLERDRNRSHAFMKLSLKKRSSEGLLRDHEIHEGEYSGESGNNLNPFQNTGTHNIWIEPSWRVADLLPSLPLVTDIAEKNDAAENRGKYDVELSPSTPNFKSLFRDDFEKVFGRDPDLSNFTQLEHSFLVRSRKLFESSPTILHMLLNFVNKKQFIRAGGGNNFSGRSKINGIDPTRRRAIDTDLVSSYLEREFSEVYSPTYLIEDDETVNRVNTAESVFDHQYAWTYLGDEYDEYVKKAADRGLVVKINDSPVLDIIAEDSSWARMHPRNMLVSGQSARSEVWDYPLIVFCWLVKNTKHGQDQDNNTSNYVRSSTKNGSMFSKELLQTKTSDAKRTTLLHLLADSPQTGFSKQGAENHDPDNSKTPLQNLNEAASEGPRESRLTPIGQKIENVKQLAREKGMVDPSVVVDLKDGELHFTAVPGKQARKEEESLQKTRESSSILAGDSLNTAPPINTVSLALENTRTVREKLEREQFFNQPRGVSSTAFASAFLTKADRNVWRFPRLKVLQSLCENYEEEVCLDFTFLNEEDAAGKTVLEVLLQLDSDEREKAAHYAFLQGERDSLAGVYRNVDAGSSSSAEFSGSEGSFFQEKNIEGNSFFGLETDFNDIDKANSLSSNSSNSETEADSECCESSCGSSCACNHSGPLCCDLENDSPRTESFACLENRKLLFNADALNSTETDVEEVYRKIAVLEDSSSGSGNPIIDNILDGASDSASTSGENSAVSNSNSVSFTVKSGKVTRRSSTLKHVSDDGPHVELVEEDEDQEGASAKADGGDEEI